MRADLHGGIFGWIEGSDNAHRSHCRFAHSVQTGSSVDVSGGVRANLDYRVTVSDELGKFDEPGKTRQIPPTNSGPVAPGPRSGGICGALRGAVVFDAPTRWRDDVDVDGRGRADDDDAAFGLVSLPGDLKATAG